MTNEATNLNLEETQIEAVEATTAPVGFADINSILDSMAVEGQSVKGMQFNKLTAAYAGQLTDGQYFSATIIANSNETAHSVSFVGEEPNEFGKELNDKCDSLLASFLNSVE